MSTTSYKIADNLFLIRQEIGKQGPPPKPVNERIDHLAVIDCSGSMYGDLPPLRKQLKNKLSSMVKKGDTVTLIAFSGRGEFVVLFEAEKVADITDLGTIHKAIDKWLVPLGLTGFKEPLEEAANVIGRIRKKSANAVTNLLFMSDGCENQWPRADVLKAVEKLGALCSASTFVEYGYYADRALLAAMAEKAGGAHIHAEDLQKFEPIMSNILAKKPVGGKRVEVKVEGDPIGGFLFAAFDSDLLTFGVEFSKVAVPEHITEVAYLSPTEVGTPAKMTLTMIAKLASGLGNSDTAAVSLAYGAVSLFAVRMKPEIIFPILKSLGDVAYIEQFSGCFGKQKYSAFMDAARVAVFEPKERLAKGYDPSKVPDDNAFTLLQLLEILSSDSSNRVLLDHPDWKYSRIGRAAVDADDALSTGDKEKLAALTEELGKAKSKSDIGRIKAEIDKLSEPKRPPLKFIPTPEPDGYPIAFLTYNEEIPNISIGVRKEGTVDLSERIKEWGGATAGLAKLPSPFPSFIFRNYAIIKDGLVNVDKLVVKISDATRVALAKAGVQMSIGIGAEITIIDLKPLPIINRSMVKAISAKSLFELEWELTKLRSQQKVWNTYRKELFPKESKGYKLVYGEPAAQWLQDIGITDYNGFNPKRVLAAARDFYMTKKMPVKLKGYSTIPSVKEAKEKMAKGKVTGCAAFMVDAINEAEKFIAANDKAALREAFLEGKQKSIVAETRALILRKARLLFGIVVGQVWFTEFATLDENTLTIEHEKGLPILGTVEMAEEKIEI